MRPSSGSFPLLSRISSRSPSLTYLISNSTQKSLDEGVEKVTEIYKSYEDVGIKDRSMIWNS